MQVRMAAVCECIQLCQHCYWHVDIKIAYCKIGSQGLTFMICHIAELGVQVCYSHNRHKLTKLPIIIKIVFLLPCHDDDHHQDLLTNLAYKTHTLWMMHMIHVHV